LVDGDGRTRGTRRFERLDPHVVARGEHAMSVRKSVAFTT